MESPSQALGQKRARVDKEHSHLPHSTNHEPHSHTHHHQEQAPSKIFANENHSKKSTSNLYSQLMNDQRGPTGPSQQQIPNKFRPKAVEALLCDINTKLDQEQGPVVDVQVQKQSEVMNHYSPKPRANWQDHKKT